MPKGQAKAKAKSTPVLPRREAVVSQGYEYQRPRIGSEGQRYQDPQSRGVEKADERELVLQNFSLL